MNISALQAHEGARSALDNASVLLNAASKHHQQSIGLAIALCVLSCEESSKSIALVSRARGIDDPQFLRAVFRDHLIKHEIGHVTVSRTQDILAQIGFAIELDRESCTGAAIAKKFDEWQSEANSLKQRGLYVDFAEGRWLVPNEMSRGEYSLSMLVAAMNFIAAKSLVAELAS